ncbi:MAG: hypothetical protein KDD47_09595 [Acidobacteria bacterium]|nr:hypothetical protein [Acidobacteriota bacterium]
MIRDAQQELARIVSRARSIEFEKYETSAANELLADLVPEVHALLQEASDAAHTVEDLVQDPRTFDDVGGDASSPLEQLADLCFIVHGEFSARKNQLETVSRKAAPWLVLAAAERASTTVARGLCALEQELSALAGTPSRTHHVDLLDHSLKGRVAATKFRRAVLQPSEAPASLQVRTAGTALARLIGRDEFRHLHVPDRASARELHRRVVDFLRQEKPQIEEGERLLEDARTFAVLLVELNQREELVRHDLALIRRSLEALAQLDPIAPLPEPEVQRLHSLFGRDDVLDELRTKGADVEAVTSRLLVLEAQLGGGSCYDTPADGEAVLAPPSGKGA